MIRVFNKYEPIPPGFVEVDTTSRGPFKDLSPFYLGPMVTLATEGYPAERCKRMENFWQYSKVYPCHAYLPEGRTSFPWNYEPTDEYFEWRRNGFRNNRAQRYPMGKGAKPLYSWYYGCHYNYIDARVNIYIPLYRNLVLMTDTYKKLYNWAMDGHDIALRDFDGYDHVSQNMTLRDVIDNPKRSMGHAFVIYGLLTGELDQCLRKDR